MGFSGRNISRKMKSKKNNHTFSFHPTCLIKKLYKSNYSLLDKSQSNLTSLSIFFIFPQWPRCDCSLKKMNMFSIFSHFIIASLCYLIHVLIDFPLLIQFKTNLWVKVPLPFLQCNIYLINLANNPVSKLFIMALEVNCQTKDA